MPNSSFLNVNSWCHFSCLVHLSFLGRIYAYDMRPIGDPYTFGTNTREQVTHPRTSSMSPGVCICWVAPHSNHIVVLLKQREVPDFLRKHFSLKQLLFISEIVKPQIAWWPCKGIHWNRSRPTERQKRLLIPTKEKLLIFHPKEKWLILSAL